MRCRQEPETAILPPGEKCGLVLNQYGKTVLSGDAMLKPPAKSSEIGAAITAG